MKRKQSEGSSASLSDELQTTHPDGSRKRVARCAEDDPKRRRREEEDPLLDDEGLDESEGEQRSNDGTYADEDQDDEDWILSSGDLSSPKRSTIHLLLNDDQPPLPGDTEPSAPSRAPKRRRRRSQFTKFDVKWDTRFYELAEYHQRFNNSLVPQKWKENPTLGKWASNQRALEARNGMMRGRYERLASLGFWDTKYTPTRAKRRTDVRG
jgi:hypothetical protein